MKKVVLTFVVEDSSVKNIKKAWESDQTLSMFVDSIQQEGFSECGMKVESFGKNDVSSFFYYMWNRWNEDEAKIVFADSCGGYKHYWNKWVHYCNEYGVRSAVDCLYGDLDTGNRDKLVQRAIECYDGMKEIK